MFEVGKHALHVLEAELHDVVICLVIKSIAGRQVTREIDDVALPVTAGRLEVGVLDDADEGKVGIVDVDPIKIGQAMLEFQHDTDVGKVSDATQLLGVGARHMGVQQVSDDRQGRSGDDMRGSNAIAVGLHRLHLLVFDRQTADSGVGLDRAALRSHCRGKLLSQHSKTTAQVGKLFTSVFAATAAAQLEFVPQPDGSNTIGMLTEFASQQWLPNDTVNTLATGMPDPIRRSLALKGTPIAHQLHAWHEPS